MGIYQLILAFEKCKDLIDASSFHLKQDRKMKIDLGSQRVCCKSPDDICNTY